MHLVGIQHAVIVGQKGVCGVRGGLCPAAGDAANGRAWARRAGLWGQMYAADIKGGLPEHRPGETDARPADTGALTRTFRAPAHRADPVPPAVLLVRRSDHGGRPVRRKLPGDRPVQALNAR